MQLFIGLCYDLKEDYLKAGFSAFDVKEFDSEETIIGLENALASLGHKIERVGCGRDLALRLASGDRSYLVFNILVVFLGITIAKNMHLSWIYGYYTFFRRTLM